MTTTITFSYEGMQTTLSCTNDEKMEDICNKLANIVKAKVNEIFFLYGATPINKKLTFNQLVKSYDRENNMVSFLGIKKEPGNEDNDDTDNDKINTTEKSGKVVCELKIKYKVLRSNDPKMKIKIFGTDFVNRYKKICSFIYENSVYNLSEYLPSTNSSLDTFEIKLNLVGDMNDISQMFQGCTSILCISFESELDTSGITNMSAMFFECSSLVTLNLHNISRWDTSIVKDMSCMFYKCKSLKFIPDISRWNTSNVLDIKFMFYGCSSIKDIPDISKWNTSKIWHMGCLFAQCSSLESMPDISKWDMSFVRNTNGFFSGCSSLKEILYLYGILAN